MEQSLDEQYKILMNILSSILQVASVPPQLPGGGQTHHTHISHPPPQGPPSQAPPPPPVSMPTQVAGVNPQPSPPLPPLPSSGQQDQGFDRMYYMNTYTISDFNFIHTQLF